MKINDMERLLGVKRSSIFYYEREGLLEPSREENNYREYSEDDLRRLKLVVVLRKLGFTVTEIRDLLDGRRALSEVLQENMARLREQSGELDEAMALCREMERKGLTMERFDADEWFETVERREREGRRFMDLMGDVADDVTQTLAFVQDSIGLVGPVYAQFFFSEEGIKKRRLWKLYWILLAVDYLILLAETYLLPGHFTRLASPLAGLVFTLVHGVIGSLVLLFCARYIIPGRKPRQALALTVLLVVGVNLLLGVLGQQATRLEVDEQARGAWMDSFDRGTYSGDDPLGYVRTEYNEKYYGGQAELDVWQDDERMFVFTSLGPVFQFRADGQGGWTEYNTDAPTSGGILYTADPFGPRKYPSRLMLTDGTVVEPVYEACFSTGYVPLYAFDVSAGQEYTGLEFGVDGDGTFRYEIDRADYAGASEWTDPIDEREMKYQHTAAELLSTKTGAGFLLTYREWRSAVWDSEPSGTLDTAVLGADYSFALYVSYIAPPSLSVRPDAPGVMAEWGLNEYTDTLYFGEKGTRLLWQMTCTADVTKLLLSDQATRDLLRLAAISVRDTEWDGYVPSAAGVFHGELPYAATKMWYVTVPEELRRLGGLTFRTLNGA